jgi:hypothetical protein
MTKLKSRRKTAFVPRIVFRVAAAGGGAVIPLCVTLGLSGAAGGCGDSVSVATDAFGSHAEGGRDGSSVADSAFSDVRHQDGVAADVFTDTGSDGPQGVAIDAFGVADIGFSDSAKDGPLGVALDAFSGG